MATITPPILIDGDGFFDVYSTVGEACSWLEAEDVEDGLYEAFDSVGHSLRLFTVGRFVRMDLPTDSDLDPDELARRLRSHIQQIGAHQVGVSNLESASLSTMLVALQSFQLDKVGRYRRWPGLLSWLRAWRSSR
jgi:hypothetical protein